MTINATIPRVSLLTSSQRCVCVIACRARSAEWPIQRMEIQLSNAYQFDMHFKTTFISILFMTILRNVQHLSHFGISAREGRREGEGERWNGREPTFAILRFYSFRFREYWFFVINRYECNQIQRQTPTPCGVHARARRMRISILWFCRVLPPLCIPAAVYGRSTYRFLVLVRLVVDVTTKTIRKKCKIQSIRFIRIYCRCAASIGRFV